MANYTGPRLTKGQRTQLLRWIAEGQGYTSIKQRLEEMGWPMIRRQAVNYYKRRYGERKACPRCGHIDDRVSAEPEPLRFL